jgi:hypothetical protein
LTTIDVDAHFEPSANWLDEFPTFKRKLPEKFPLPEVPVFSSDYPHFEGSSDPDEHYDKELAVLDDAMRDGFLKGNIAASYALMGDPL